MTTSTELRRIVGAMTERPWFLSEHDGSIRGGADPVDDHDVGDADFSDVDMTAVLALANHADALVALVEACERLHEEQSQPAVYAVMRALAAVHAVKQ